MSAGWDELDDQGRRELLAQVPSQVGELKPTCPDATWELYALPDRLTWLARVFEPGERVTPAELADWLGLLEVHAQELPAPAASYLVKQLGVAGGLGAAAPSHVQASVRRALVMVARSEGPDVPEAEDPNEVYVPADELSKVLGCAKRSLSNWTQEGAPAKRGRKFGLVAWARWAVRMGKVPSGVRLGELDPARRLLVETAIKAEGDEGSEKHGQVTEFDRLAADGSGFSRKTRGNLAAISRKPTG